MTSAAGARDFPDDEVPEIAMVGRSNVGKSSLINALVRQRLARTSGAPGKTRLANIYRVARGTAAPLYLVDLPGYGFARGGSGEFAQLLQEYFGRAPAATAARNALSSAAGQASASGGGALRASEKGRSALLLIDARHPGLTSDAEAWRWLRTTVDDVAIVATKIDKLARGERIRVARELESVFDASVLPVSAVTGEGLDELWKLIARLANNNSNPRPTDPASRRPAGAATAPRPPKRARDPRR